VLQLIAYSDSNRANISSIFFLLSKHINFINKKLLQVFHKVSIVLHNLLSIAYNIHDFNIDIFVYMILIEIFLAFFYDVIVSL